MGRIPPKKKMNSNQRNLYSKINNLLNTDMKEELDRMKAELNEQRKEIQAEAERVRQDADKYRKDLQKQIFGQNTSKMPPPPDPPTDRSLYNSFYDTNFNKTKIKQQPQTKKKQLKIVDRRKLIDKIEDFSPATHSVRVSTGVTSQDRENGTRKIIGMETVEWWEYVLIYGFFKATKIAYEYNIVKDMIKNPQHIVSLVNKGVVILSFIPKVPGSYEDEGDVINGEEVIVRTGTAYREFKLTIELPYKTGTRKEEVKKGYFLYEENFETVEVDYEELGRKIAQELNDKKVNEDFKRIIINEIENGRISRV